MTNAIVTSSQKLTPDVFQMIMQVAPIMHEARLFGTKTPQQAAAIMIKGFELGFSLTASFENIHMIDDKPGLSPKGALALIYNSPEYAGIKVSDDPPDAKGNPTGCTVWMRRRNGLEYIARFTMDDARRAGLVVPKSGWEKYPANMLRWRAIGYCADVVFPDVIGGTKRADEYGAEISPDGDVVIDAPWMQSGSQATGAIPEPIKVAGLPYTVSPSKPSMMGIANPGYATGLTPGFEPEMNPNRLSDLLAQYGAEKVMGANGNKIPGTNEELDAIEAALAEREMEITGGK